MGHSFLSACESPGPVLLNGAGATERSLLPHYTWAAVPATEPLAAARWDEYKCTSRPLLHSLARTRRFAAPVCVRLSGSVPGLLPASISRCSRLA